MKSLKQFVFLVLCVILVGPFQLFGSEKGNKPTTKEMEAINSAVKNLESLNSLQELREAKYKIIHMILPKWDDRKKLEEGIRNNYEAILEKKGFLPTKQQIDAINTAIKNLEKITDTKELEKAKDYIEYDLISDNWDGFLSLVDKARDAYNIVQQKLEKKAKGVNTKNPLAGWKELNKRPSNWMELLIFAQQGYDYIQRISKASPDDYNDAREELIKILAGYSSIIGQFFKEEVYSRIPTQQSLENANTIKALRDLRGNFTLGYGQATQDYPLPAVLGVIKETASFGSELTSFKEYYEKAIKVIDEKIKKLLKDIQPDLIEAINFLISVSKIKKGIELSEQEKASYDAIYEKLNKKAEELGIEEFWEIVNKISDSYWFDRYYMGKEDMEENEN